METYQNPILYADYSDPDVIRVGEDFYMTASSFTYFPGVPLLHSRDLVHWELINYCVNSLPFEKYQRPSHGSGTWAPAIRYHKGEFFVFIPLPDEGIYVARGKDPRGTFEGSLLCESRGWIDPCPFWDEDGRAYMIFAFAKSRCGIKHRLALVEIKPDCSGLLGEPRVIFDGTQMAPTTEGPKMYKKDGWYYVLMPSGGVASGWQSALRSRNIWGPYEYRIVMHQGNTGVNGPHQGGWVDTPDGRDWFIHFQDVGALGRITHLQPMCWNAGWPVIGMEENGDGIAEPVQEWEIPVTGQPHYQIPESDDFTSPALGLQWQWQSNPRTEFYELGEEGLSLFCLTNPRRENLLWYAPNLLTQIPQHRAFQATVQVRLDWKEEGDMAAVGMTGLRYGYLGLKRQKAATVLCLYEGQVEEKEYEGKAAERCLWQHPLKEDRAWLRLMLGEDGIFRFSWSGDGEDFSPVPGDFPLTKGTWTGAKLCLWSCSRENLPSEGRGIFRAIEITSV
ncbi:MAG TPA: glycoside hydrolase 43 family protein [Candidatus Enterocloster faecavium]|uniref:Glycoside hydrolase 43 family protein n=1 Tax=Candidatus Enterocloster faecavium TaxID=2838560 RepID=A0A9D2RLI6_9FIRM|nr:glycoside hydrolase 43 family protein [Candidatus Enterocloster faecavium]